MKIYLNGEIKEDKDARISVYDRGYLFGEGLFESFKVVDKKVAFLDLHLARMEWSASYIGIPFPMPSSLTRGIAEVLTANDMDSARIKIVVSSLGSDMSARASHDELGVNVMVSARHYEDPELSIYEEGVGVDFIKAVQNDQPPLSEMKTTNWLTKMIAMREVEEKRMYDGILTNSAGMVVETSKGNIFWGDGKTIYTPPKNAGLLNGVTRQILFEVAEDNNIPLEEKFITPEDLMKAKEIFITNSVIDLVPVTQLAGEAVGDGAPGEMTHALLKAYLERVEEEAQDVDSLL